MRQRLFRRIVAWRWLVVAFWVVVSVPCAFLATRVGNDSSVDGIIDPNDPGIVQSHAFAAVFGRGEMAVLILEADDPYAPPVLARADALVQALAAVPGVTATSIVTTFREAKAGFDPQKDGERLRRFATGTSFFREQGLVGDDFLVVALVLDTEPGAERDDTLDAVDRALDEVGTAGLRQLRRVGKPYVNRYFDAAQKRSGPIYFGLFMAFVVVLTVALFRSWRTLCAILLTLGVCLAVSMGFIGLLRGKFTLVSPMVPMTILVTATATLVYLHARFVDKPDERSVEDHQIFALGNKFLACTASIFAAAVGFAALFVSHMKAIRDMGVWVAGGLFFTWLVAFTLFPALQRLLRTPTRSARKATASSWFAALARVLPGFTYRFRWPLVLGALVLSAGGVVAVFGAGRALSPMTPLTEPIEYVSRDSDVYRDTVRARAILPGLSITQVWIKGDAKVNLADPPMLSGLERFERALAADEEVGSVVGLPSILRMVLYAGDRGDKWPGDDEGLEELAEMLESLSVAKPQAVRAFVDRGLTQTQFTVINGATEHEAFARLQARIDHHWQEATAAHPALAKLELSTVGLGPLQAKMSQSLVPTLVESFALTAGIIFVTFLIVFRSGAARIMTMLPSLFAILVMFLVMRITGMAPNVATILIASTVLGTSENDQIHFFYHFQEGRRRGTVQQALEHTFLVAGRAVFFATIINAGGFLAFAFAEVRPMQQFGGLTALALGLSMVADFTALPAALWLVFRAKPDAVAPAPAAATAPEA
ncbi:MAG: MMPL family transporter [Myxococcales bacterium]|nr:MMPL family transporter [Myxococcales bacterium]